MGAAFYQRLCDSKITMREVLAAHASFFLSFTTRLNKFPVP